MPGKECLMNPLDLPINNLEASAGSIVLLREMLLEHSLAEAGIVPREVITFGPRFWWYCCHISWHNYCLYGFRITAFGPVSFQITLSH